MRLQKKSRYLCDVALIPVMMLFSPAMAQAVPEVNVANTADGPGMGDIIVTARRRDESLSKVPISISALSSESLTKQGIRTEADLQIAVPGLQTVQGGNGNLLNFAIRGQTIDGYSQSPSAVLTYVNEFQITAPGASAFFDLANVQVLKGPQGTLFGRNTTGGAVLYTTAAPVDEFKGFFTARAGNLNEVQVQGAINVPLVADKVLLRVAGNFSDGGGFVRNRGFYTTTAFTNYGTAASPFFGPSAVQFTPRNNILGNTRNKSVRATLLVKPIDGLRSTTMVQYGADDGTSTPGLLYSVASNFGAQTPYDLLNVTTGPFQGTGALTQNNNWQLGTNRETYTNLSNNYRSRTRLIMNTTEYDLSDDLTVKNIVGWYRSQRTSVIDLDGSAFELYGNSEQYVDLPSGRNSQSGFDSQFSEELQLQGKAFDGALNYTAGVFYTNSKNRQDNHLAFYAQQLPPFRFRTRDRSYAGFAQATYNVTDRLHVTGGFRYSKDKIDSHQLPFGNFTVGFPGYAAFNPAISSTFEQDQKQSFRNPSWNASVDYQLSPDLLVYVTQRGSWRAGGYNFSALPRSFDGSGTVTSDNPAGLIGNQFGLEKARDVEGGVKFNGRIGGVPVTFAAAAYNQWIAGAQRVVFVNIPGAGPGLVTVNVPKTQITGQEFNASVRPIRWLELGGQIAHLNARFTNPIVFAAGLPQKFGPYAFAPKWAGSAYFEVNQNLDDGGSLSWRADVYAQSSSVFANYQTAFTGNVRTPGYALVNSRVSWNKMLGSSFTAAAYAKNLLDKQYYAGGIGTGNSFGVNLASPGRPREFGLELRVDF